MEKENKKETALVPYAKPEIKKKLDDTVTLTENDFYKVAGKTVPSARALQWAANRKRISTKVIEWGSDNERAWVRVAGWIGEEDKPIEYKEAIVEINYEVEKLSYLLTKQKRNNWRVKRTDEGVPEPMQSENKAQLYDYLLRKRQFGIREALTKAEAIINRKLLSMEFREKEEIMAEKEEIEAVTEQIAIQKGKDYKSEPPKEVEKPKKEAPKKPAKKSSKKKDTPKPEPKGDDDIPEGYRKGTIKYKGKVIKDVAIPDSHDAKGGFLLAIIGNKKHPLNKELAEYLNGRRLDKLGEEEIDMLWEILVETNENVKIEVLD